ncbi:MAG TPA: hypothetical protein PLZ95_14130 [Bryobacteraceae bacterium]|nr:hypothetical protein [Bryobacteraceae bacterium]
MAAIFGASIVVAMAAASQGERNPGLSTGKSIDDLPVPASGYQVYLLGEMHGIVQNERLFEQYLIRLNRESGLRDVAIEEDPVYAPDARAYVEGRRETVPAPLCLRAGILEAVRRINQGREPDEMVRVHLVDIDTPAEAIRLHLESIRARIPAAVKVAIPGVDSVAKDGLETVDSFERLTKGPALRSELRTIRGSIEANRLGLEVGTGEPKGSPYLDAREDVIAADIRDIVALEGARGVLAFYGSDHVSKSMRRDGGANRDRPFAPMALRLEQAGLKVFSLMTFPLTGRWAWRGRSQEMLWTPDEGRLESGETLDKVANAAGAGALIYIDRTKQGVILPSTDLTNYRTEAVLLFSGAQPLPDRCSGLN